MLCTTVPVFISVTGHFLGICRTRRFTIHPLSMLAQILYQVLRRVVTWMKCKAADFLLLVVTIPALRPYDIHLQGLPCASPVLLSISHCTICCVSALFGQVLHLHYHQRVGAGRWVFLKTKACCANLRKNYPTMDRQRQREA